jgi:class 3 adenylate cyclase/tetratricopeptide (TPR) repeat protein
MQCSSCRSDNPEGSRFCLQCGAGLGTTCPGCGADLPGGARFCNQCGAPIGAASAAPAASPAPSRERSPREYTPRHLAEKILTQKSALEGERKQVTVLFADVKSSLDMQEAVDPEEWHGIMDRFFQILADGVHRFEGTINQYTGDGIMALFGAPIGHEDHAQRACYAALHLSDALREYARELRRDGGLDFSTRMGINSGEVVVGKIGDDLRMDYTAQGQTVGLAARMEALAEPGKVYLTGYTAEPVKGYFELEDLGSFNVKGVSGPVPVFELTGVGALRTRFDVSRARGLTRFVGRDGDMKTLDSALESAKQGKGRAVGIVANAGVGKSRLCFEFAERCRAAGVAVLQGSGVAHGKNIPLLPVLEIFRAYFAIDEREDPRQAREKVAGRLLLLDDTFREVLPLVFDFLGIPDPERPPPPMTAEARQRRLVAVVRRLIERANPGGFVILIEDLHWVDPASDDFVAEYVEAIANGPGLLLVNYRPEYRADWMNRTWYQQLPLDPLSPDAIRELLGDLLGQAPSVQGLAERIHTRTQGNPYFTEEIVRSLVESGTLQGTRGHYELTAPVEALEVPYSVHAVLSARIDRLPEREKQVLQRAAVIGKEVSEPILARVADLPEAELAESLAALCSAEFIHQESLYPIAEYAFAHPLTREVALGSQLQEQRRRTHAAVARAIQAAEAERLDEHAALLAHHWEEAGEPLQAARFHARAANWTGTKDLGGTLRHWQRVRELVRTLSANEETVSLRLIACLQILVLGGFRLGLSEAAVDELYAEGNDLAERVGNQMILTTLRAAYGARICGLGRVREYVDLSIENVKNGDEAGSPAARAGVRVAAAYASFLAGRLADAWQYMEEGEEVTGDDLVMGRREFGFSYRVFFAQMRAGLLGVTGRLGESRRAIVEALRVARESGVPENVGWALGNLSLYSIYTGELVHEELGDARVGAAESFKIAQELGSGFSEHGAYHNMANVHFVAGDYEESERYFAEALELSRTRRIGLEFEASALAGIARARSAAGRPSEAVASAEEAVALARQRGQNYWELFGELARAEALCAARGARARTAIGEALDRAAELVEETGAHVYTPWIAEARARLAKASGDAVAAGAHLREAHRLYAELGATGHTRRVASELASA